MSNVNPNMAWVRHFVDYAGLIAFLIVLAVTRNPVTATWGLVAGAAAALLVGLVVEKRLASMPLVYGLLALFFGGLTLFFKDPRFIQVKLTVVYVGFAVFLFTGLFRGKNPLRALLGETLHLPAAAARTLTIRYGLFFAALAVLNELIRNTQTFHVWAYFKLATVIATVIFALAQAPLLLRYAEDPSAE